MLKRFLLGGLVIVLLATVAVTTALRLELEQIVADITPRTPFEPGVRSALDGVDPGKPQTIMVLGSDRRWEDERSKAAVRSDTLMLLRLDPTKDAMAVMSLPRDLKVELPTRRGLVTDKINSAYSRGGSKLALRTVRRLLDIPIHHLVVVDFRGFRQAVNRLKCVYVDVDRRYFHSNKGVALGARYAAINIPAGYQKLCGAKSLDYVRHRYTDNDFVRAARQQEYLRAAKNQIGVGRLISDRRSLLKIVGDYAQTDIDDPAALLRLLALANESSKNPVREVRFPGEQDVGDTYVTIGDQALRRTVREFMAVRSSARPRQTPAGDERPRARRRRRATSAGLAPGLIRDRVGGEDHVLPLATKVGFPVYFPEARLAKDSYVEESRRGYTLADREGKRHRAYRIVLSSGEFGQFYGVQGTTWRDPPILDGPFDRITMRRRRYEVHYDGRRIRLVAWRTPRAVYWLSNTLSQRLSNRQMLDIARSLRRP